MGASLEARERRLPRSPSRRPPQLDLLRAPVPSAQVKSCVLLAALSADGMTTVSEPVRSRDHTERMLLRAGVSITREAPRCAS